MLLGNGTLYATRERLASARETVPAGSKARRGGEADGGWRNLHGMGPFRINCSEPAYYPEADTAERMMNHEYYAAIERIVLGAPPRVFERISKHSST